jgi:Flp pilus assembly protein protease CpaA
MVCRQYSRCMWWPFIALAFPISFADVRSYSIPNIYLWWLLAMCTPHFVLYGFGPSPRFLLIIVIFALLHLVGLGMGDVKLLLIIFLYLNPLSNISFEILALFLMCSATVYVISETLWKRKLPQKIPLAPSIFSGLALYLASR